MKMDSERFNVALTILICSFVTYVHSDFLEECNKKPSNAFIVSNTSCSHYVYCAGDDSYEGECPDGDYFNQLLQTCDPRHLVECKFDTSADISDISSPPTISAALSSTVKTPNGAFTTTSINSTPPTPIPATSDSAYENANTTSAAGAVVSTTTVLPNINGDTAIIISTECPPLDNPRQMVFVSHRKSCSDYFICYHGVRLAMHCSSMLHFNANTGKCDYPENVRCQIDFSNPRDQCQLHTIDLFPHTTNCNYFYYCRNGYLLLQQCPFGYGWDFEKRACITLQQAMCYNGKNRRNQ